MKSGGARVTTPNRIDPESMANRKVRVQGWIKITLQMVALCHDPELLVFTEYKEYTFPLQKKKTQSKPKQVSTHNELERKKTLQK